jgi:Calpain large subunit, domain III
MEVFSSEPVKLNQLSESNSRIIAGEWTETTAGGSHLNTLSFKKNPRFTLKLRKFGQGRRSSMDSRSDRSPYHPPPVVDLNPQEPVKCRITVTRVGLNWKAAMKKDTVGCMVGFYLFIRRNLSLPTLSSSAPTAPNAAPSQSYELVQIYESTFAPDYEASTEEDFVLGERSVLCFDVMRFAVW